MPSIRASQNIDTTRLHDDHIARRTMPDRPMVGMMPPGGVSTLMGSSLPLIAAGTDLYVRQFYGTTRLPQRRFLPVGGLG